MCDRQRPPRVELLICFVVSSVICAFLIRRGHFTEAASLGLPVIAGALLETNPALCGLTLGCCALSWTPAASLLAGGYVKVLGAPESSSEAWEGQDLRFVTAAAAATMLLVALRPASGSLTRAKAAWPAAALSALCLAVSMRGATRTGAFVTGPGAGGVAVHAALVLLASWPAVPSTASQAPPLKAGEAALVGQTAALAIRSFLRSALRGPVPPALASTAVRWNLGCAATLFVVLLCASAMPTRGQTRADRGPSSASALPSEPGHAPRPYRSAPSDARRWHWRCRPFLAAGLVLASLAAVAWCGGLSLYAAFTQGPATHRSLLLLFWALLLPAGTYLITLAKDRAPLAIVRKAFHVLLLALVVPGLAVDWEFTCLATSGALLLMVSFEIFRMARGDGPAVVATPRGGRALLSLVDDVADAMRVFTDDRDAEELVVTHLSLFAGSLTPLWFAYLFLSRPDAPGVPHLAPVYGLGGLLVLCVGDTLAAVVGSLGGRTPILPGSRKTVEGFVGGLLGCWAALLAAEVAAGRAPRLQSALTSLALCTLPSGSEALLVQLDNLFLPAFMSLGMAVFLPA